MEDFVPVHKESLIKCNAKGDVETNSNARKEIENSELRTFQKYGALQNHMLYGRHEKKQEKITLIDRAKKGYARKLEMQYGVVPSKTSACVLLEEENDKSPKRDGHLHNKNPNRSSVIDRRHTSRKSLKRGRKVVKS